MTSPFIVFRSVSFRIVRFSTKNKFFFGTCTKVGPTRAYTAAFYVYLFIYFLHNNRVGIVYGKTKNNRRDKTFLIRQK